MIDLEHGPSNDNRYHNFYPLIADFLAEDTRAIEEIKSQIEVPEWERAAELGHKKLMVKGIVPRNSSPYLSNITVKNKQKYAMLIWVFYYLKPYGFK